MTNILHVCGCMTDVWPHMGDKQSQDIHMGIKVPGCPCSYERKLQPQNNRLEMSKDSSPCKTSTALQKTLLLTEAIWDDRTSQYLRCKHLDYLLFSFLSKCTSLAIAEPLTNKVPVPSGAFRPWFGKNFTRTLRHGNGLKQCNVNFALGEYRIGRNIEDQTERRKAETLQFLGTFRLKTLEFFN